MTLWNKLRGLTRLMSKNKDKNKNKTLMDNMYEEYKSSYSHL